MLNTYALKSAINPRAYDLNHYHKNSSHEWSRLELIVSLASARTRMNAGYLSHALDDLTDAAILLGSLQSDRGTTNWQNRADRIIRSRMADLLNRARSQ